LSVPPLLTCGLVKEASCIECSALTDVRASAFLIPQINELTAATIDIKGLLV
jgi:hypothetical protein